MNDDDRIATRLKALPPTPVAPNRFEEVAARVRHRRRVNASLMFAAVLLIVLPVTLLLGRGATTDPPVPIATDPTPTQPAPSAEPTQDATDQALLPGSNKITKLSEPVTVTHTGTATVALGRRPANSTAVSVALTCLSPGKFIWPNGGSMTCSETDFSAGKDPSPASYPAMELKPKQTEIVIRADEGASWQVTTFYVSSDPTPWGVNAKGETYGVEKGDRSPDLIAVSATNGKTGYVYVSYLNSVTGGDVSTPEEARDWMRFLEEEGPPVPEVPVFEPDGETQIGVFEIG